MSSHSLRPRTLGATDYPSQNPLDEVLKLMGECAGAVILGYPQISVADGTVKDKAVSGMLLATEWNHIEAGLAYAEGLPLLVIHHVGIARGVFDRGAVKNYIHEVDLAQPEWPLDPSIAGAIKTWKSYVEEAPDSESPSIEEPPHTEPKGLQTESYYEHLSLPSDLDTAVGMFYGEYRCLDADDLSGAWRRELDLETGYPIWATGCYTGRTDTEYATFLVGTKEVRFKIVVLSEDASGQPVFIELESGSGTPRNRYLRTLKKGSHPISRAVWKHGGPRTLHLENDALVIGSFESAACAYYWNDETQSFHEQWLSD